MNAIKCKNREEASAIRRDLLSNIRVQALCPVKMLSNTSSMSDDEVFDMICLAPINQTIQTGSVFVSITQNGYSISWPKGYGGFACEWQPPSSSDDDFNIWLEVCFGIGTAKEHVRFAAFYSIGVEEECNGTIVLKTDPRVNFK